jgi:hypothetical protein
VRQEQSDLTREGSDELDLPLDRYRFELLGANFLDPRDDETASDDSDESDETEEADEQRGQPIEDEDELEDGFSLEDLIGSRPPVVCIRLCLNEDKKVDVVRCITLRSKRAELALQDLAERIGFCFSRQHLDQRKFTEEDRQALFGTRWASPVARFGLLLRLAVHMKEKILVGGKHYRTAANNVGPEKFAYKFAALPDGMPFSVRLLLRGGKKEDNTIQFSDLPDPLQFLIVCRALEREEDAVSAGGDVASTDAAFYEYIATVLREPEYNLSFVKPAADNYLSTLRPKLARAGLGHVFPKSAARKKENRRRKARREGVE